MSRHLASGRRGPCEPCPRAGRAPAVAGTPGGGRDDCGRSARARGVPRALDSPRQFCRCQTPSRGREGQVPCARRGRRLRDEHDRPRGAGVEGCAASPRHQADDRRGLRACPAPRTVRRRHGRVPGRRRRSPHSSAAPLAGRGAPASDASHLPQRLPAGHRGFVGSSVGPRARDPESGAGPARVANA